MTGDSTIRGTRIGAGPTGDAERGDSAPRNWVEYWCADEHRTRLSFAVEAEVPRQWDCVRCGLPAGRDRNAPPEARRNEPYKSHLAYVKERRSESEGAALLEEALSKLGHGRAR